MTMAPSQLGAFARSVAGLRDAQPRSTTSSRCRSTGSASRCTLPGLHRQRLQSAPDQPRLESIARAPIPPRRPSIQPNYLTTAEDRRVAAEADPAHAPHRLARRRWRATRREEFRPGAELQERRRSWRRPPATSAPRSSTPSARRGWARADDPQAVVDAAAARCAASTACASPMPRSCRPSPRATPTRRP